MSPLPQTLGIGRRTRRLAEQLERVRRYGACHRRLAALRPYASGRSRRHRSAKCERGTRRMGFQARQRTADPRLACIPELQPIKVNSTLSMNPDCRMPGSLVFVDAGAPSLQPFEFGTLSACSRINIADDGGDLSFELFGDDGRPCHVATLRRIAYDSAARLWLHA